ncbi:class II aldolase/adducin family protein [Aquibium sp. LZ166]|uniref:Class II aldolase/adducin family protein n=1 Tax=Aquibium pacificus TaxID=3153579 RepID=A0ABV3SGN1_9HYPH
MTRQTRDLVDTLVLAHRILVNEGVLDAFGHASVRDPDRPDVFWLGRALPPSRLGASDVLAFDLDSSPLEKTDTAIYSERFIHSEIYRARPDVHAVCHHHAPSLMPFCVGQLELSAVSQTGAFLGSKVTLWDSTDEFGPTRMLIDDPRQAASLARALDTQSLVLMRGHGTVVVGRSIEDMVFKAVYACRDADAYRAAAAFGAASPLSPAEIALCGEPGVPAIQRGWEHWTATLATHGDTIKSERVR